MNNTDRKILNELSVVGRLSSVFYLFIFGLVGTIFLILGIILMFKKDNYSKVNAVVESQNCVYRPNNSSPTCNTVVSYFVNGASLRGTILMNQRKNQGDMVDIYYDQNNVNSITYTHDSLFIVGLIVTVFSVVFLTVAIGNYYLTSKNKIYAANQGVGAIENLFRR